MKRDAFCKPPPVKRNFLHEYPEAFGIIPTFGIIRNNIKHYEIHLVQAVWHNPMSAFSPASV